MGCEYVATDLPNPAFAPAETPEAPLGIVVANPPGGAPARLTVRDASGATALLVSETTIEPPLLYAGSYEPVTVQTEVRDGRGIVTALGFEVAEELEIPAGGEAIVLLRHQRLVVRGHAGRPPGPARRGSGHLSGHPRRQYRTLYPFLAPGTYFYDHLTVIAPSDAQIQLDGERIDLAAGEAVPGTELRFVHLTIEDGPHEVRGTAAFGVLTYAYDDFVSYAFTGGLNLIKSR